jgi:hypothetical protein
MYRLAKAFVIATQTILSAKGMEGNQINTQELAK